MSGRITKQIADGRLDRKQFKILRLYLSIVKVFLKNVLCHSRIGFRSDDGGDTSTGLWVVRLLNTL